MILRGDYHWFEFHFLPIMKGASVHRFPCLVHKFPTDIVKEMFALNWYRTGSNGSLVNYDKLFQFTELMKPFSLAIRPGYCL